MVGLIFEVEGLQVVVGSCCNVINESGYYLVQVEVEVMGFFGSKVYLMLVGSFVGIVFGVWVVLLLDIGCLLMGMLMFGCVFDGVGCVFDGKGGMCVEDWVLMDGLMINLFKCYLISEFFDVGICLINGLFMVGCGQCFGLFVGIGVGKLVLLGMMICFIRVDIIVVGLIGEWGCEVKEFIDEIFGEEGFKCFVVVVLLVDDVLLMCLCVV